MPAEPAKSAGCGLEDAYYMRALARAREAGMIPFEDH